jgi:MFS family permease
MSSRPAEGSSVLDSAYSWKRLVVSLLIATICNVGMWAVIVVMPNIEAEFGTARGVSSIPYTMTMIGYGLGNLLIGRAIDRYGVTFSVIGAAVMLGGGYTVAAASPSIHILWAAQIVIGFGTAAGFGPLIADVSHWFLRRRGIAVGIVASGNYLSGAVWPTLLSGIQAEGGWRASYSALAVIVVVALVPLAMMLRRRIPEEATESSNRLSAIRAQSAGFSPVTLQWLLAIAGVGCCVAMAMPQVHLVSLCVDRGYGAVVGAQMLSLMLLGGVVSRMVSGIVADRLGGVLTLLIGSTLQCIALFLYLPFDGMASLYAISLVFGLSQGGIVPSYTLIVREYMPSREAGRRIGFIIMATIVGMAFGGWLSGWIFDVTGSYRMAFINGIGWNLLNITIMVLIWLRSGRPILRSA